MSVKSSICFVMLLSVVGCGGHRDIVIEGRNFHDKAHEAIAFQKAQINRWVNAVEPLASPLAGPAILVLPTRHQLEGYVRRSFPREDQQFISDYTTLTELKWEANPQVIKRRNIFEQTQVVRAKTPAGLEVPRGGYLVWFEVTFHDNHKHMMASGESEWTQLVLDKSTLDPSRSDYSQKWKERLRQWLLTIEDFVKRHPPSTTFYLPSQQQGQPYGKSRPRRAVS